MQPILINGQRVVPLRALPYFTNGAWSASDVATLLYDPNWSPNPVSNALDPQHIDASGNVCGISGTDFMRMREDVYAARQRGASNAEVRALYAGVFVPYDIVRPMFEYASKMRCAAVDYTTTSAEPLAGLGDHWPESCPMKWNDNPVMTKEERELLLEGFATKATSGTPNTQRDAKGKKQKWKEACIEAARTLRKDNFQGKITRRKIAKQLAEIYKDKAESTIYREIDASWWKS